MDTRSAAALVDDPRGALARPQATAGVRFAHLDAAAQHTATELAANTGALASGDLPPDMSIVVFGSWPVAS
jgi:hypothetical protein